MYLGVLSRFLNYLLFRLTPYDMLTSTRRIYLGAFQDFCHGLVSLSIIILIKDKHSQIPSQGSVTAMPEQVAITP
jgi:hypothetical protein